MLESLLEKPAQWLAASGVDADIVVGCRGVLRRNLADYPFPAQCSDDQRIAVEERLLEALDGTGLFDGARYYAFDELDQHEVLFLSERYFIGDELVQAAGPRGAYIVPNEGLCATINGVDHLSIHAFASGTQVQEVWKRLDAIDDACGGHMDYAYHARLGYLTSEVSRIGTGLRLHAILHLPALALANLMNGAMEEAASTWHVLAGLAADGTTSGDLYQLSNKSTLGRSEEELGFFLRHCLGDFVARERKARETLLEEGEVVLQDRVGRALGVARGAHLLEFNEGVQLLSSLRLGVATGELDGYTFDQLNELLVTTQQAHLALRFGRDSDGLALSAHRAAMFRSTFS